jgi:hypothetical protein
VIVRLADYGARGIAMVSLLHEGVIKLVRDRPAFAADLLGQLLDVEVPRFTEARIAGAILAVDRSEPQRSRTKDDRNASRARNLLQ